MLLLPLNEVVTFSTYLQGLGHNCEIFLVNLLSRAESTNFSRALKQVFLFLILKVKIKKRPNIHEFRKEFNLNWNPERSAFSEKVSVLKSLLNMIFFPLWVSQV